MELSNFNPYLCGINQPNMEHITKFPRYCSVTGRGMYEGYVIDDGMYHASDVASLLKVLSEHYGFEATSDEDAVLDLLDETYDKLWYWTEWEDSDIPEWDEDTEVQA